MFIAEMSENHGYSYAFYCWRKSSKMKYIKVGVCWYCAGRLSLILKTGNWILSAETFIR